jgi:hypothetical protein
MGWDGMGWVVPRCGKIRWDGIGGDGIGWNVVVIGFYIAFWDVVRCNVL